MSTLMTEPVLWLSLAALLGPLLGAYVVVRGLRARDRRQRVLGMLDDFLGEPMASTRRSAWAFLQAQGAEVRHFSHYYLTDPTYGEVDRRNGFADLLRVLLFQRTVQDLRRANELDERLYGELLEPHRRAWATYTAAMAEQSATHPEARERGDAGLFSWREV